MISLGLIEQDGLAIMLGVAVGLISLALITGTGVSVLRLGAGGVAGKLLKKIGFKWFAKLGLKWAAKLVRKLGFHSTAPMIADWSELLLLWDPETLAQRPKGASRRNSAANSGRKTRAVRPGRKLARPSTRRPHLPASEHSPMIERLANPAEQ
jgi:hypothetical protein